jgi:uncharacterized protein with PIN domain
MTDLLVDTSVAVPLVLRSHDAHVLVNAVVGGRSAALSGHAASETYAVLTRLPGDARVAPADAIRLLTERFDPTALLDSRSARRSLAVLADLGIAGGATYDGLVGLVAKKAGLPLASRDLRAEGTYRRVGVDVEMVTGSQREPS